MANELEQRAREHLLAYLTHLHPEHDEAAYNSVTETVAALQQAQQPGAQAVGYVSPHVVEHLRSGGHSCTTITSHRAMLDDVALYTAPPPLPEGVSEEDVDAALKVKWPLHYNVMSAARLAYERDDMRKILESYRARLVARK